MTEKIKLTVEQENFVRKYIECSCASEAYRHAYNTKRMKPETIHVEACKLLTNPKVATRVNQLQEQAQKRHEITFDRMIEMLIEDRTLARQNNQTAAAISADTAFAKMLGFMTENSKVKVERNETHRHFFEVRTEAQKAAIKSLDNILKQLERAKVKTLDVEVNSNPNYSEH